MPNALVAAAAEGLPKTPPDGKGFAQPHPRAIQLALAAVRIDSRGVGFRDLLGAGFSAAELVEHMLVAEQIASSNAASTQHLGGVS